MLVSTWIMHPPPDEVVPELGLPPELGLVVVVPELGLVVVAVPELGSVVVVVPELGLVVVAVPELGLVVVVVPELGLPPELSEDDPLPTVEAVDPPAVCPPLVESVEGLDWLLSDDWPLLVEELSVCGLPVGLSLVCGLPVEVSLVCGSPVEVLTVDVSPAEVVLVCCCWLCTFALLLAVCDLLDVISLLYPHCTQYL